ncbi:MAG: DUF4097 domain-containing protein [Peptococcaceae bacterium]|nr:DUF4097 domain-containing protein [Peptococcaceae bacterium]
MNRLWLVLGIVVVVGLMLMGVGLIIGGIPDLYIDWDGIHLGETDRQEFSSGDLGKISGLDVLTSSIRVEIIPVSSAAGETASAHLSVDCDKNQQITWSVENGELRVRQTSRLVWQILNIGGLRDDIVRIYIPTGDELNRVVLKNSSGVLSVDGISCQTFDAKTTSGKLTVSRVYAQDFGVSATSGRCVMTDCGAVTMKLSLTSGSMEISGVKAETLRLTAASGGVKGNGIITQGLSAHATSGSVRLAGEFAGDNTFEVQSGSCTVETKGSKGDYSRYISVNSGTVWVNGQKTQGNDVNTSAPNSMRIKVTSGSARVVFLDD